MVMLRRACIAVTLLAAACDASRPATDSPARPAPVRRSGRQRLEGPWGRASSGVTVEATADGGVLPAPEGYDYLFLEHPALRSGADRHSLGRYPRKLASSSAPPR